MRTSLTRRGGVGEFQFLIGSMKSGIKTRKVSPRSFQFLIGSMKYLPGLNFASELQVSIPYRLNEMFLLFLPVFAFSAFQFLIGSMKYNFTIQI